MAPYHRYAPYKSQGEYRIGNFLEREKIPFQYEYPLAVVDRGQTRLWYPDFSLPDYHTLIEYFGMIGDATYNKQMAHKLSVYQEAGLDVISLVEATLRGDWQGVILERIEQNLEGRLRKIRYHQADRKNSYQSRLNYE